MRISDWSSDVCSSDLVVDPLAVAEHAGTEELDHQQVGVSVDHQAGQAVAFAVDHAPGVGHRVEVEDLAAQAHRFADPVRKPGRVDRHVRDGLQHSQGDARVAVVETARSEEHTSELQSLMRTSYAVFLLNNNKAVLYMKKK